MLVKHLQKLVTLTEQLLERTRPEVGLVLVPLGKITLDASLPAPPHDYQTSGGTSPVAGRVVGLRLMCFGEAHQDLSDRVNVRHFIAGKDRIARFHGGELPAGLFPLGGGSLLAWGTIGEGDPIELNLTRSDGGAGLQFSDRPVAITVQATLVVRPEK